MKKKRRKVANLPAASGHRYSREEVDKVTKGTERGIRDTYAWKDMVRRVGLKETRRILKLGLLASKLPERNPQN